MASGSPVSLTKFMGIQYERDVSDPQCVPRTSYRVYIPSTLYHRPALGRSTVLDGWPVLDHKRSISP